jgi:hypothetical protein
MTGWKQGLSSDFVPEWCGIAAVALLDTAWARAIHFHLTITPHDGMLMAIALGMMIALRVFAVKRGGVMAEYFSLNLAAALVFGVLSYLCLASSGTLADARLLALDRALGFDWMAGYRFLLTHPAPAAVLQFAYNSLVFQGLYFCVLLGLMNGRARLREIFWLVFLAGLFTCAGCLMMPALGPFQMFGAAPPESFLPEMLHLRSGQNLNFALAHMTGVVSFPSFHTAMALAYIWAFRGTGPSGWGIAGLNLVMLCAVPWLGGHYLCDMIAGAAAMLAALGLVKGVPRLAGLGWTLPHIASARA